MKKTGSGNLGISFVVFLSGVCLFLFSACGMQEYFSLDAPVSYHKPDYSTTNYLEKYFEFQTASNSDVGDFTVLGTAVYYKIYSNATTLVSDINSVESVNKTSNGSAAARKIIESYLYKPLGTTAGSCNPLISDGNSKTVKIRLSTYGDGSEYKPYVIVAGVEQSWKPVRTDNKRTFEFGRGDSKYSNYSNNVIPAIDDEDVKASGSGSVWYVNMYAVSVGRDANYTNYYSLVTHLGTVSIDSGSEDN